MSAFTEAEEQYLVTQMLGRLATIGPDGAPQVRPVGFTFNRSLGTIDIGGRNMSSSRKFHNVRADGRVSFVVDDLASIKPWLPRGVEIRGTAVALVAAPLDDGSSADLIRIHPLRIFGWGLDSNAFGKTNARAVGGY